MALLSKGTKDAWGSALRSYLEWCGMEGLEDTARFPITLDYARLFVSSLTGIYRVEGIKKKMIHLRDFSWWANVAESNDNWNFNLDRLKPAYSAMATVEPHPKLKRAPLLSKQFQQIFQLVATKHSLNDRFHLAMLTVTIIGFTCLLRSEEFTFKGKFAAADELDKKPRGKNVVRLRDGRGFNVYLPWDKVQKNNGTQISVVDGVLNLNGATLLAMHLDKNEIREDDFVWSYIAGRGMQKGHRMLINKASWLNWFNDRLAEINERPLQGHSIRIGGATQMLLNGVDPNVVKSLGRWSAKTSFYKYWRHVNALVSSRLIGVDTVDVPEEDVQDLYALP
ncbi:uncharacterized protein JCM15063_000633 [Sporobolomyces koalae]|uniref:uncharacterized protein n=1 Tax=Sporobolomyces koalae TaxID=500713 RepID=UPI00316E1EF1